MSISEKATILMTNNKFQMTVKGKKFAG